MPKIRMPGYPRKRGKGKGPKKYRSVSISVDAGRLGFKGRDARLPVDTVGIDHVIEVPVANITIQMKGPVAPSPGGTSFFKTDFPKLGAVNIGTPDNYWEVEQIRQNASRYDAILFGFWRGWSRDGLSINDVVGDIKAKTTADGRALRAFKYNNMMQVTQNLADATKSDITTKYSTESGPSGIGDWYAYDSAGQKSSSYGGQWDVNIMPYVTPDGDGNKLVEWYTNRQYTEFYQGGEFNAIFFDIWNYKPPYALDWNRDGSNTLDEVTWRESYNRGADNMRALTGNAYPVAGNVATYPVNNGLDNAEWSGYLDIALYEVAIGDYEYSTEKFGWNRCMAFQGWGHESVAPGGVVFFHVGPATDTDYSTMRYGLATALLDNSYAIFSYGNRYSYSAGNMWFDEFDLVGTDRSGWLGQPTEPPVRSSGLTLPTAWQNGCYKREYDNGIAIVNPRGNGTQTLTLPSAGAGYKWQAIAGAQDPAVNDGAYKTQITNLPEQDGRILRRVPG